jgi:Sulfotransferase domain
LFGGYALKNVKGLQQMDYEDRFYNGEAVESVTFEERGFIYGPIRLSNSCPSMIYSRLIKAVSRSDFIRDKIAIFLIRDPRDVIVSSYYSFGYTHSFSNVKEVEEEQRELREKIQGKTIDNYALAGANYFLGCFQTIERLFRACKRGVVLKYEDMIDNWEQFVTGLTRYLEFDDAVLRQIYERSRPLETEDLKSHRRSGKPGGHREKLAGPTLDAINTVLAPILKSFGYES